jgi:hypothetical protein
MIRHLDTRNVVMIVPRNALVFLNATPKLCSLISMMKIIRSVANPIPLNKDVTLIRNVLI